MYSISIGKKFHKLLQLHIVSINLFLGFSQSIGINSLVTSRKIGKAFNKKKPELRLHNVLGFLYADAFISRSAMSPIYGH